MKQRSQRDITVIETTENQDGDVTSDAEIIEDNTSTTEKQDSNATSKTGIIVPIAIAVVGVIVIAVIVVVIKKSKK